MRRVYERLHACCWFCWSTGDDRLCLCRSERSDGNSKAGLYSKEEEKALTHAIFTSSSNSRSVFGQFFFFCFFFPRLPISLVMLGFLLLLSKRLQLLANSRYQLQQRQPQPAVCYPTLAAPDFSDLHRCTHTHKHKRVHGGSRTRSDADTLVCRGRRGNAGRL